MKLYQNTLLTLQKCLKTLYPEKYLDEKYQYADDIIKDIYLTFLRWIIEVVVTGTVLSLALLSFTKWHRLDYIQIVYLIIPLGLLAYILHEFIIFYRTG